MKKQKREKKALSILIAMCGVFLLIVSVSATENINHSMFTTTVDRQAAQVIISPQYTTFTRFQAYLDINDAGYAICGGYANVSAAYTCNATLKLQQKRDLTWVTIKDWSSSGRNNSFDKIWFVERGYDYRLQLVADAYNSRDEFVEYAEEISLVKSY